MSHTHRLSALAAAFLLIFAIGCAKNPADDVAKAETGEVPAVTEESVAPVDAATVTKYTIAASSTLNFVGSKVTGSHSGGFKTISGHFSVADGALVGTEHDLAIDMNSTWSDSEKLTAHLKASDFFNVEEFPDAGFKLTSATASEEAGQYALTGNFTLHGVTKEITFPAALSFAADALTLKADFSINRMDYGVAYPGKKDDLIRPEVVIKADITAAP
jgi:polyisoprenoid-binding protein YceI